MLRILGIDHPNKDLYYVIQARREKEKLNCRFTSNKDFSLFGGYALFTFAFSSIF